jgi:ribosome-associated protein
MTTTEPLSDGQKQYLLPAFDRKPQSITALNVSGLTSYADTLVVIEGSSRRQVTSIAEHIIKTLKSKQIKPLGQEGVKDGEWALIDYGDMIIHIFESDTKALYDLEGFWADAPKLDLSELGQLPERESSNE